MIANYSTKPTKGALFEYQRDTMLDIKKEVCVMSKDWYKKKLMEYNLWDNEEDDLIDLKMVHMVYGTGICRKE